MELITVVVLIVLTLRINLVAVQVYHHLIVVILIKEYNIL